MSETKIVTLWRHRYPGWEQKMGVSVGGAAKISRSYVESLRSSGWHGLDEIPEDAIVPDSCAVSCATDVPSDATE